MKLVVLGATGGVGKEIVAQSVERGHEVTAFVRNPAALGKLGSRVAIVHGDPLNAGELQSVIRGNDAVLSGFGPRLPLAKVDYDLLRRFVAALRSAMEGANARRLVIISTAFLFKRSVMPPAYLLGRLFFSSIVTDSAGMERSIQDSGLDWTIVRPPQLTDKPRSGTYRVRTGRLPAFGFKISRADVADFMIRCAEQHESSRKVFGVSR